MATKPILAAALNADEASKLTEALVHATAADKATVSMRALAGEVGVMYVKRLGFQIWNDKLPHYVNFASAMNEVITKAAPAYSNARVLIQYARDSAKTWFVAEGDVELKAAREAADAAKAEAKAKEAEVAKAKAEAKREDVTVAQAKVLAAKAKEVDLAHKSLKAVAATKATEYAAAYETKFPKTVVLLTKQNKLDNFVAAVKSLKATFEALEDGTVDKHVHDSTKDYLGKMSKWTEAK
jgi:hypothetical protein